MAHSVPCCCVAVCGVVCAVLVRAGSAVPCFAMQFRAASCLFLEPWQWLVGTFTLHATKTNVVSFFLDA